MPQSSDGLALEINYILSVCGRQIGHRLNYIRKLSVQRFSSPREERHTAVGPDRQGPIAIKFNFFCGVPRYVALRIRGQLGRRTEPRPKTVPKPYPIVISRLTSSEHLVSLTRKRAVQPPFRIGLTLDRKPWAPVPDDGLVVV